LHEEHAPLVPAIEAILKEMLIHGRVAQIRSDTFERIRRRAAQGR
jgi:hypothetical protein